MGQTQPAQAPIRRTGYACLRMGSTGWAIRRHASVGLGCALLFLSLTLGLGTGGCSSGSDPGATTTTVDDLKCLSTLARHCCDLDGRRGSTVCLPEWPTATLCTSWPSGTPLQIYASPCHGL